MEIEGFDDQVEFKMMVRDMNQASRMDREERTKRGVWNEGFLRGKQDTELPSAVRNTSTSWMVKMRSMMVGHIIRRDNKAQDYKGEPIIPLEPYIYAPLELELTPLEMDAVERRTEEWKNEEEEEKKVQGEVRLIFYLIGMCFLDACRPAFVVRIPSGCRTQMTILDIRNL